MKDFPSRAPSSQGKPKEFAAGQRKTPPAFHFNRPPSAAATVPITLYDSIFAQFQIDCETYTATKEDHAFVLRLSLSMSKFYNKEWDRADQARLDMGTYDLDFLATEINGYRTDGDLRFKEFCYAILEYKLEISSGEAEPLFQGGWYYTAFVRRLLHDRNSHFPCFILYAFGWYLSMWTTKEILTEFTGAHVGFAGAIWTDRPHLQVLAPALPLFYHSTDTDMRTRAARYFGAAKKAIFALKDYYKYVLPSIPNLEPARRPNPAFPYPTQYASLDESTIQSFEYLSQLEPDKLVFCGKASGHPICVKFARQYSKEAHLECSSSGFAPALRGFERLAGGWFMVVMDYLGDEYELLADSPVPASFSSEVREKIISFHQLGFVHGDIRTTNIMVQKNGEPGVMFIDFDWAGRIGTVRYPMNVNTEDIKRPDGAIDNKLILAEHDIAMIDFLFL
jgi:hypothetical protein